MKKIMFLSVLAIAVAIGSQNLSMAADVAQKYAVVDVKKVVNSSASVKKLKDERKDQKEKVLKFIKESNEKVAAEKDAQKQEELKKKLNNDLKYMTTNYDKRYQEGLKQINDNVSADIAKVAKDKQYELILTTDAVLFGGDNITNQIVKEVK